MNTRWILVLILPFLASCTQTVQDHRDRKAGTKVGLERAQWEWKHGLPVLYSYGIGASFGLDEESGLPQWPVAGCVVGSWTRGLVDAHNKKILALVDQKGLPDDQLSRNRRLIKNPEMWFQKLAKDFPPFSIIKGHDPIFSPDKSLSLSLVGPDLSTPKSQRLLFKFHDRDKTPTPQTRHLPGNSELVWYVGLEVERVELFWVADSDRLAVLAYQTEGGITYSVADLKTGGQLYMVTP